LAKPAKPPQRHYLLGYGGWPYCGHFEPYKQFFVESKMDGCVVSLKMVLVNTTLILMLVEMNHTIFYKFTANHWSPSILLDFKVKTTHATITIYVCDNNNSPL
jgi:hypothetical protein